MLYQAMKGAEGMIEITQTDKAGIISEFGFKPENGSLIMVASDNGIIFGAGEIKLSEKYAVLKDIKMKENYDIACFKISIAKSLLNLADLRGIKIVFSNSDDEKLTEALKFAKCADTGFEKPEYSENLSEIAENYKMFLNLKGYFTAHCC